MAVRHRRRQPPARRAQRVPHAPMVRVVRPAALVVQAAVALQVAEAPQAARAALVVGVVVRVAQALRVAHAASAVARAVAAVRSPRWRARAAEPRAMHRSTRSRPRTSH
jgi:hypothetical protein